MRLRNIPGSREVIAESPFCVQDPGQWKGRWKEYFGNDHPIHVEIGMGKGRFLMEMAHLHPEINYVGIEMYSSVLIRAIQKAEAQADAEASAQTGAEAAVQTGEKAAVQTGEKAAAQMKAETRTAAGAVACAGVCGNFCFLRMDARELPEAFAQGELERIYLNFSDPWPKDRHAKRRLTSREFLQRYEKVLPAGGILEFKTDNRPLFDFSLEEVKEQGWELESYTKDLHADPGLNAGNVMTEYEERFSAMGNPICKLTAHCPGIPG